MWISTIVLFIFFRQGISQSWNYHDFDAWGTISEVCTVGANQSPLDLRAEVVGPNDGRPNIQFFYYNSTPQQVTIENNGHTVQLTGTWNADVPSIAGPYVVSNQIYLFSNLHLHWSNDDNDGTEHSIRQKKYAAELHLVHYNNKYENFSIAADNRDGIAVVAILFQVDNSAVPNVGLQQLAFDVQSIVSPGNSSRQETIDLTSFLPNPIGSFYSYSGSLTTPPCSENVRWIILSKPQAVSSEILSRFRNVNLNEGDDTNVRPLQSQNTRLIEFYK